MMKMESSFTSFAMALALILFFSSCKKDEAASPEKFPTGKVADKNDVATWD